MITYKLGQILDFMTTHPVLALIIFIDILLCNFILFKKMGLPGITSIIPIVNLHILYKKTYTAVAFYTELVCCIIGGAIIGFGKALNGRPNGILTEFIIADIFIGIALLLCIIELLNLCKSFGKGTLFFIGMLIVPLIFLNLMAFNPFIRYKGKTYDFWAPVDDDNDSGGVDLD